MATSKLEIYDKLAYECGKQIHKHTIQLLVKGGKYGYRPYGTGVLVFAGNKCLIITAAHVIKDSDSTPIFVNSNKGIIPVYGDLQETDLEKYKTIDLAYIILEDAIAFILVQTYHFIPVNKINLSHNPTPYNQYLVAGYPEVNISEDITQRKITTGCSIFLLAMSKEKVYEHYGYDTSRHYILTFAGKGTDMETNEKTSKIEDPYGMSGCGLWLLTEKPNTDSIQLQYHLIGIMTEFKKGKYHCLIGNKIALVMGALAQFEGFSL